MSLDPTGRRLETTRRRFVAGALGAATLAIGGRAAAQSKEVVIATTGGLMERSLQEHFYKRFEAESGVRVRAVPIELPDQWARARAGQRSGNVLFDVVTATPPDLIQHADLLQPLDCAGMPGIVASALPKSCFSHGIIRTAGGMALTWSKKAFPQGGPQSWADFFDVKAFPGARSLPDTGDREWWVPLAALLADGVPPDKAFPMDVDRAYKKLDTIKPHVAAWWKSGDNAMQIMRGGDAVMTMVYSSRAVPLAKSSEFDFTWNQAIRDVGNWAVLKGGPNTQNGVKFLDFFVQNAKEHVAFSEKVSFDSNNREASDLVPVEERRYRPSWPDNWSKLVIADYEWVAANRNPLRERWVSWLTK
ncbi:extracellular solute-binding protein [Bradyrhizobium sp. LHD-71]|uniref:extracellular solute-binding protein n=1 Tax=Bradyrhizobium sp. LHD-71 TaxID=3072141 RepID=UPI00280FCF9A|nr:extracellular solute-binding protein [Bradyrhizobium sp. LHD-71]MDQ8728494.1 extracellular solute-binding protein [Bradyrhizobium sp. LHD-71]